MTSIHLTVTGAHAWATVSGPLTSGMVGVPVTIEYDEAWEGLTKNLVCRCSPWNSDDGETRVILNVGDGATVAHEVMQAGQYLHLGVEGFREDGSLVMPTIWAMCGEICAGANSDGDPSADPTLPVWSQLQAQIEQINRDGVTQERMEELRGCAETASQAAADAARSEASAAAAASVAISSANGAEAAADQAKTAQENAQNSASSAANLANGALQAQRAAESAAQRAEAAALYAVRLKDGSYNVLGINHRGYSVAAPENTIPAYIKSREMGFNYAEADVSFTADGVAVLLHDSTIDRTSNGSGSISEMTYAEASRYDYGSWKSAEYAGTRLPTFEEFIILCKRIGLHPYIELKQNGAYTQAQIQGLVEMVKNCGMDGRATWISFDGTFLGHVKAADPCARLGYLVSFVTADAIATALSLRSGCNEVFLDSSDYDGEAIDLCRAAGLPLEIWTVNSAAAIESMPSYITGVTSDNLVAGKVLQEAGMVYDYSQVSGWGSDKFYFELTAGQIQITAGTGYLGQNNTRVSYVGTDCTLIPGKRYRLTGVSGVRYGIQTITASGYAKIQSGGDLVAGAPGDSVADKLDSGWQVSGYEFVADASAVCAWVCASYSSNGDISPTQAMPVYLEQIG